MSDQLTIGLFGFGCVGQGLYDVLKNSVRFHADIRKICVRDRHKSRTLPDDLFTFDKNDILNDPSINLVVELIDDAEAAYHIVKSALQKGKHVVTANKKMIAEHLPEWIALQQQHNVSLLYEASCCGGIPIIRTLEEYYDNEELHSVSGIFNGSSNYILTRIFNEGADYGKALQKAQELGFAETDPQLDVGGGDAKYKLMILAAHAYGLILRPEQIYNSGIQHLRDPDITLLRDAGFRIRLHPVIRRVRERQAVLYVIPQVVAPGHHLFNVEDEYNAVLVEAAFSDQQLFIGKGAGGHPTGSAVLSDISALSYGYRYEYKKAAGESVAEFCEDVVIPLYIRTGDLEIAQLLEVRGAVIFGAEDGSWLIFGDVSLALLRASQEVLRQKEVFIAGLLPELRGRLVQQLQHSEALVRS